MEGGPPRVRRGLQRVQTRRPVRARLRGLRPAVHGAASADGPLCRLPGDDAEGARAVTDRLVDAGVVAERLGAKALRLELSRVNQRALNDGLVVPRYPSYA